MLYKASGISGEAAFKIPTLTRENLIFSAVRICERAPTEASTQLRREHALDGVSWPRVCTTVLLDPCTFSGRASGQRARLTLKPSLKLHLSPCRAEDQTIGRGGPSKANTVSEAPFVSFSGFQGKTASCYWNYCGRQILHDGDVSSSFSSCLFQATKIDSVSRWDSAGKESKSNTDTGVWMIAASRTRREPVGR